MIYFQEKDQEKHHMIFDTHAHYDDEAFDSDRDELIKSLFNNGIIGFVDVGADMASSRRAVKLAHEYNRTFASVGVHPDVVGELDDDRIEELYRMALDEKVVAIGEIGLDYHYDKDWEIKQKEYFDAQLSLSEKLKLPVIIHDREAHMDVFDIIKSHPNSTGIIHSCSESNEMVKEYIKRGWYISFSGTITFKNASKVLDAVKATPLDRILVETDCPYLTPEPYRGKGIRYTDETIIRKVGKKAA